MADSWTSTRRELEWLKLSGRGLAIVIVGVMFAAASVVADRTYIAVTAQRFQETVDRCKQAGLDVEALLKQPTGEYRNASGGVGIANPLRWHYEELGRALALATPAGAAGNVLTVAPFLLLPVAFFILGVLLAQHGRFSRTVSLTWADGGLVGHVVGKVAAVSAAAVAMQVVLLVTGAIGGALMHAVGHPAAALGVPAITTTTWGRLILLMLVGAGLSVLVGLIGLTVGSAWNPTLLPIMAFALCYFLVPLLGPYDPRNAISAIVLSVREPVSSFRPQVIAGGSSLLGSMVAIVAVAVAVVLTVWATWWRPRLSD